MSDILHSSPRSLSAPMLFSALPDELRERLSQDAKQSRYGDDQIIQQRGELAKGFYLIESGSVAIGRFRRSGEFRGVAILGPGDSWGELAMFTRQPRVVDAVSRGESTVRFVREADFEQALSANQEVMRNLLSAMSRQLQELLDMMSGIRRGSAKPRIAATILAMVGSNGKITITQGELGELLGLTRATVNSTLREMEHVGALKRHYGELQILDREALEEISID